MSEEIVVCPRCGKKYRLRADAEVDAFPCKECGASVKVKQASMPTKRGGRSASAPCAGARGRKQEDDAALGRCLRSSLGLLTEAASGRDQPSP